MRLMVGHRHLGQLSFLPNALTASSLRPMSLLLAVNILDTYIFRGIHFLECPAGSSDFCNSRSKFDNKISLSEPPPYGKTSVIGKDATVERGDFKLTSSS